MVNSKEYNDLNNKINDLEDRFTRAFKLLYEDHKNLRTRVGRLENRINVELESIIDTKIESIFVEPKDVYTTKAKVLNSETVSSDRRLALLDSQGVGLINQLLLQSTQNNFSVYIQLDDNVLFRQQATYQFFEDNNDFLENSSAFLNAGVYTLSIRNLNFQENAKIDIFSEDSTEFSQILLKYYIRNY